MKNSRRQFVKNMGLASVVGLGMQQVLAYSLDMPKPKNKQEKDIKLTVLFQGDSITDGNRTRDNDWNHVMGHGYAYLISSRLWYDHPEQRFMFFNRGISGNTVSDLNARWQNDTINLRPDIVSILIGVNDINYAINAGKPLDLRALESEYRKLLNRNKKALPKVKLVLCEPFILDVGHVLNNTKLWHDYMASVQAIVKNLALEFNAIFIPFQEHFTMACKRAPASYWIWDGIHPMPAGHELMSRVWINEMKSSLPFIE